MTQPDQKPAAPGQPPRGAGLTPGAPSDGADPAANEAAEPDPGSANEYGEALKREGEPLRPQS